MANPPIIKPEWVPSGYSNPPVVKVVTPAVPVKHAVRQLVDRVRKVKR